MFEDSTYAVLGRWLAVAMPGERIFILYLASSFALAFLAWLYYRRLDYNSRPEKTAGGFWAYLLDKDVFLHRSAKQDYIYFFVNAVIYVGIISQLLISTHFFMLGFHGGLENMFGTREQALVQPSLLTLVAYTVAYALLVDFAVFITHYAQHKIPVLWEFHKVHHSAEVLTPITLYRMHPVDLFFTGIVSSMLAALGFAGFFYLTANTPSAAEMMGVNIIFFLFYLIGYNLRHSHIWLSYPVWLSNIVISPAQHQIHHSVEPKHFDKNLGLVFSIWDKMCGTLYVPRGYEKISYGISKKTPNPYNGVADMYLQPFRNAWKIICPDRKARERAFIFVLALVFCAINYGIFFALDRTMAEQNRPLPSVHAEDLTWTEVHKTLGNGTVDTIIIPTGGTEQNGPHLALGKHNHIVRHNAGEIARRLGGALVAPVIAHVPEDVHMPWAGTVTISEATFEDLLAETAESYIRHGFKNIVFLGDSHGNQQGQEKVAARLQKRHDDDGVKIVHAGDYYAANGQKDWLLAQGFSEAQIGGHAGIRDTAEILYIWPEGLRRAPWIIDGMDTGMNGDPARATKKIGRQMTELKINAALKQLRQALNKPERQDGGGESLRGKRYLEP